MSELEEKNKIFVVYNQQRWDQIRLIKGFINEEDAEKLRKELKEKEGRYEEIYCIDAIEIEENFKSEKEEIVEPLKCPNCGGLIMFDPVIDCRKTETKTACGRCNEVLTINIEVKNIKGE